MTRERCGRPDIEPGGQAGGITKRYVTQGKVCLEITKAGGLTKRYVTQGKVCLEITKAGGLTKRYVTQGKV